MRQHNLLAVVILAACVGLSIQPCWASTVNPNKLLVKFRSDHAGKSVAAIPLAHGATASDWRTGIQAVDEVISQYGRPEIARPFPFSEQKSDNDQIGLDRWFCLLFSDPVDVLLLQQDLQSLSEVEAVSAVHYVDHFSVPSDSLYVRNWGHNNTGQMRSFNVVSRKHDGVAVGTPGFDANAPLAWNHGYGDWSVVVAIIDDGFDLSHPDINFVPGRDVADLDDDASYGVIRVQDATQPGAYKYVWATHGTECAGVAAAVAQEFPNYSAVGAAGGCRIMPVKVCPDSMSMDDQTIVAGIMWAAQNDADVISVSLGHRGCFAPSDPTPYMDALLLAHNRGIPVLVATGNDNMDCVSFPARLPHVISVGAASPCGSRKRASANVAECNTGVTPDAHGVSCDNEVWWGSNFGPVNSGPGDDASIDVVAPTILPTTDVVDDVNVDTVAENRGENGSYSLTFNGTSCATPYAAGVAALIKSQNVLLDADDVRDIMMSSAIDIVDGTEATSGWDRFTGYGMVNAAMAVALAGSTPLAVDLPNSQSILDIGVPTFITWHGDETYPVTSQKLEISYDGGSYALLDSGSGSLGANVHEYQWTPSTVSDNCRIRLTVYWSDGGPVQTHLALSDPFRVQGNYRVISGSVKMPDPWAAGVANVQIFEGATLRGTTGADGNFSFEVPIDWTGVLHAEKAGNAFLTGFATIDYLSPRNASANFIMNYFTINGVLTGEGPFAGITVDAVSSGSLRARSATSNASGVFSIWAEYNWTGELVPHSSGGGQLFDPSALPVGPITGSIADVTFAVSTFAKWGVGEFVAARGRGYTPVHDRSGNALVVYFRAEGDVARPDRYDLMFNRFAPDGVPSNSSGKVLADNLIHAPATLSGNVHAVGDGAGGVYAGWTEGSYSSTYTASGRYCHVDGAGNLIGDPAVVTLHAGAYVAIEDMAACPGGGFYVAYVRDGTSSVGRRAAPGLADWDLQVRPTSASVLALESDGEGGVYVLSVSSAGGSQLQRVGASGSCAWTEAINLAAPNCTGLARGPAGGVYVYSPGRCDLIGADGALKWGEDGVPIGGVAIADGDGGIIVGQIAGGFVRVHKISQYGESIWPDGIEVLPTMSSDSEQLCSNGDGGVIVAARDDRAREYAQEILRDGSSAWGAGPLLMPAGSGAVSAVWPDGKGGMLVRKTMKSVPYVAGVYDEYICRYNNADEVSHEVHGIVADALGVPVPHCAVVARETGAMAEVGRALTSIDGSYVIAGIPPYESVEVLVEDAAGVVPSSYRLPNLVGDEYCSFVTTAPIGAWGAAFAVPPAIGQYRVTNAVGFCDFDANGDLDMYAGYGEAEAAYRYTAPNTLLLGGVGGSFSEATQGPSDGYGWTGPTISVALGDFDNDGNEDMYLCNGDAFFPADPNVLLRNSGGASGAPFATVDPFMYPAEMRDPNPGGKAEWTDLNGDGFLDLFVGRPDRTCLVFRGFVESGTAGFQAVAVPGLTNLVTNGSSSWADFDNDGLVDVVVFAAAGNRLLRNNGDWTFADVTYMLGGSGAIDGFSKSAAWGDYDNDGDVDLFVNFHLGTPKKLFRNDVTMFADVTADVGLPPEGSASSAAAWSDLDNDGDLDLIWTGASTVVWENHGAGTKFTHSVSTDLVTHVMPNTLALGDVDGDGDEDAYLGVTQSFASPSGAHSILYENRYGDHGNSIGVALNGTTCNRDGIGAIVRVHTADGSVQTRQLTGMTGGSSPQVKEQIIGIGDNEVATKVQVQWPWGRVTEVPVVAAGSKVVVSDASSAPVAGSIYLTTSPTGERVPPTGSWNLGDYVDFYLAADFTGLAIADATMGGFEVRVTPPGIFTGLTIEPLYLGVDSDPQTWEFSVRFDENKPLGAGPIPLLHFHGQITREGGDGAVAVEVASPCSFMDPIDPDSACWWGGESNVLYRFGGDLASGGIVFPVIDVKPPLVTWCSLYPEYLPSDRSWVAVAFDEPLAESCFAPEFLADLSHFRIYNPTNPLITKSILFATRIFNSSNGYLLKLSSPIQAGKLFDLEVTNVSDRHGNVRAVSTINVSLEEDPDIDLNEIFFAIAKSGNNEATVEWVELRNSESAPMCISGWTVANGAGGMMRVPDSPLCVLQPGGHAVLVAAGTDTAGFNEDIVLVCAQTQLAMVDGTLALLSPFGVQTDVFDAGTTKDLGKQALCSYQRFAASELKAAVWELDGPEFAPGLHGTPGFANRRLDGSGSEPELPTIQWSGLLSATPNPFNPAITIELMLKEPGQVRVRVYDIMGRVVRTLLDEHRTSTGLMELVWDGRDSRGASSASGVYFVKMDAPDVDSRSLKITLLR